MNLKKKKKTFSPSLESEKGDGRKFPLDVVIGVSCGGAFVLCLLAIFVTRLYQRRVKKKARHFSDGVPEDVPFPNAEKYEMKKKKGEEDIVHIEERGIWNKAAME